MDDPPPIQPHEWKLIPRVPGDDRSRCWPWWFSLAAVAMGLLTAVIVGVIAIGIYIGAGGHKDDKALNVISTVIQDFAVVGVAFGLAMQYGALRLRDFGWRHTRALRAVGLIVLLGALYFIFLGLYTQVVHIHGDTTPRRLGANTTAIGMVAFVLVAVLLAPFAEETFFRGFFFRSLWNGFGLVPGIVLSACFFGILHWDFQTTNRLLAVVPLTLLGALLAILYYYTRSLFPGIALHATNNAIATLGYAIDHHSSTGTVTTVVAWVFVVGMCLWLPRITDPPANDSVAAAQSEVYA